MKSSFDGNDPRALEEFLCDLICETKRPEDTDLLMRVLLTVQQTHRAAPNRVAKPAQIDRPATPRRGPAR
jgi:hypothetical protein